MSTKFVRVMVLTVSTRPTALGPAVATWFLATTEAFGRARSVDLVPVSLADLDLPFLDEDDEPATGRRQHDHTRRWAALVAGVEGFVVITPEYNHGMPASLKNALDYLTHEWAWKPVGFVAYGNTSSGTRSVQHATPVLVAQRLVRTGTDVYIPLRTAVHEGRVVEDQARDAAACDVLEAVARTATALRPMREAMVSAPGPAALPGSYVRELTADDAPEVTVVQRCCWVDEARANATLELAALSESPADVAHWLHTWRAWGLWRDGRLVAMVRGRHDAGDWHIGRLAVVPDLRGSGVGRWMLALAEQAAPTHAGRVVLRTGASSAGNLRLYAAAGYVARPTGDDVIELTKTLEPRARPGAA